MSRCLTSTTRSSRARWSRRSDRKINPNATVVKGAFVGTALPVNTPYIAPNVQMLDEHHQILEGSMVATIGKTTETLRLTEDWVNNNDARVYVRYPNSNVI